MDITNKIQLIEQPLILNKENPEQLKQDISKPTFNIDDVFNDKVSLNNGTIKAEVIAIKDENITLKLDNGKQIVIKLDAPVEKGDQLLLNIKNGAIDSINIKDVANNATLNSKTILDFLNTVNNNTLKSHVASNTIPVNVIADKISKDNLSLPIKALIGNLDKINIILEAPLPNDVKIDKDSLNLIKLITKNDIQTTTLQTNINKNNNDVINLDKNIKPDHNIKNAIVHKNDIKHVIKVIENTLNDKITNLTAKPIQPDTEQAIIKTVPSNIQGNNQDITKPAIVNQNSNQLNHIINKKGFKEFSLNSDTTIKVNFSDSKAVFNNINQITHDTKANQLKINNNEVKSIIVSDKQLSQLINNEISNISKATKNINTFIKPDTSYNITIKDNKITIPVLNNLSLNLEPSQKNNDIITKLDPKLPITFKISDNKVIFEQSNSKIPVDDLKIKLSDDPIVNKAISDITKQAIITPINNETIKVNKPDSLFSLILNIKNSIGGINPLPNQNGLLSISDGGLLKLDYSDLSDVNNSGALNKSIPNIGKDFFTKFIMGLTLSLHNINSENNTVDIEKTDILAALFDTMTDTSKVKLQNTLEDSNSWRYFIFPYNQDEHQGQGELLYNNQKDIDGNDSSKLAIKINLTNLGDVMVKFQINDKQLATEIHVEKNLSAIKKVELEKLAQSLVEKSGFYGSVSVKNNLNVKFPLLKNINISYNKVNITA